MGNFSRYYFNNLSRFWRHILWRHGFRTPVETSNLDAYAWYSTLLVFIQDSSLYRWGSEQRPIKKVTTLRRLKASVLTQQSDEADAEPRGLYSTLCQSPWSAFRHLWIPPRVPWIFRPAAVYCRSLAAYTTLTLPVFLEQWFLTCGKFPTGGEWRSSQVGNDRSDSRATASKFNTSHPNVDLLYKSQPFTLGNGELAH